MTPELDLLNNIDAILEKSLEVKDLEVVKIYIMAAQNKIDLLRPFIEELE
ncbi:MAG: hypothetical protein WBI40_13130 [Methylococcaceae bacterium]